MSYCGCPACECETRDPKKEEQSFRRGYHHGWLAAVEAVKAGKTERQIDCFANQEVVQFRATEIVDDERQKLLPPRLV